MSENMTTFEQDLAALRDEAKSAPRLVREAIEEGAGCIIAGVPVPKYIREILTRWRGRRQQQDKFGKGMCHA